MIAPDRPSTEQERLADLQALQLLDTPPEERFDRLVRLAMDVFDVPIAYLALIDADRQWLKAKCGIARDQTGRDKSFCGHTILGQGPLIVNDAAADPRFCDNPLVVESPGIRFYAGHPLAGPAGHNVGTLCIADTRARALTDRELSAFCRLAALAQHEVSLVDLVTTQRELLRAQETLAATQRRLSRELSDAAAFVTSMLPQQLTNGPVRTAHRFIACSELGGDMIGVGPPSGCSDCLAFYLLDVSGHGVGSSLLSIAVANAIRLQSLPGVQFDNPASVLTGLNKAFPAEDHHDKFFTIWYGSYHVPSRQLTFASGGHHPAILLPDDGSTPKQLGNPGPLVGMFDEASYENTHLEIAPNSRLYLFSDGAFELSTASGHPLGFDALTSLLATAHGDDRLGEVVPQLEAMRSGSPEDDLTLLELHFPG